MQQARFGAVFTLVLVALFCAQAARAAIPEYKRGKDYQWILSKQERDNGISYLGAHTRLRTAVNKLRKGEVLKIATVGGSITAGQGCVDAPNWPNYLFNYLKDTFGQDKISGHNGAVAGTTSGYMSVCHNLHVPKDADIVFVEYSINDWHSIQPYYENESRRSFERLLRKLLKYPNGPAVVFMHAFAWFRATPRVGTFWSNTEREFNEYALYYGLPSLSLKACCFQKMVADEPGFHVKNHRSTNEQQLKDIAFYYDPVHPDGRTGARVMGELAMNLIQSVYDELEAKPFSPTLDHSYILPAPMVPGNYESVNDKCFIGIHFTHTIKSKEGWDWINESKTERPKWGFIATTAGAALKMEVDTRATSSSDGGGKETPHEVLVELAYLRSYEHMGKARVTCEGDCNCLPTVVDGHQVERNSQLFLHNFYATQGEKCMVVVTVVPETSSGEHKFKLAGIMISEESGQHDGIRNNAAVEYVGDISQRGKDGTFNAENHARRRALGAGAGVGRQGRLLE